MIKKIIYSGESKQGRREENQDSFLTLKTPDNVHVFAICDGMGGHYGGKIAAQETIKVIKTYFSLIEFSHLSSEKLKEELIFLVKKIQTKLLELSTEDVHLSDMGTTLNLSFLIGSNLYTLNVGDSRSYFFDGVNEIEVINEDHNLRYEMKKVNTNLPAGSDVNVFSNFLTSSLGPTKQTILDLYLTKLSHRGFLFLASDGVYNFIDEKEVQNILLKKIKIKKKADEIIKRAIQNESSDNLTCIVIEYEY